MDAIIQNPDLALTSLSDSFKESRVRIAELEKEVDRLSRVETDMISGVKVAKRTIQTLEQEKGLLRQELVAHQDTSKSKVKEEEPEVKLQLEDTAAQSGPDASLNAEQECQRLEAMVKDLEQENVELKARSESHQKEATELAAALELAKAEALKSDSNAKTGKQELQMTYDQLTLDVTSLREEVESLNADVLGATSASAKATATLAKTKERLLKHKTARADLQNEYDELSAQKDDLEQRLAEAELQVNEVMSAAATHNDAIVDLRAKYKQVTKEKVALQEASILTSTMEELQTAAASTGSVEDELTEALGKLRSRYEKVKTERKQLREKCSAMEAQMEELERQSSALKANSGQSTEVWSRPVLSVEDKQEIEAAQRLYREYMQKLPSSPARPPFEKLEPVCYKSKNLHSYLAERSVWVNLEDGSFHYLAFGPSHRYDQFRKSWTEGSDLESLHGGTREVFVDFNDCIVYVGTYKCHDLRHLYAKGIPIPARTSHREILDATVGVPTPPGSMQLIKQMFPDGIIKVVATGLQSVGFNEYLYDSLRRRFAEKRAAEERPKEDAKRKGDGSGEVPQRKKPRTSI
ncbi:hypothetical protein C8J57DRAFT_1572224 [Mycena rebaudengoi]|nr:hypothetical protein C8J57DRAFT_1572224 [Mycena rebaudengoi]